MSAGITKGNNRRNLETEIDNLLEEMSVTNRNSDEYSKMAGDLETICRAKSYERARNQVDPNQLLLIAGSLVGTFAVLMFERNGVLTSKAISWIPKIVGRH